MKKWIGCFFLSVLVMAVQGCRFDKKGDSPGDETEFSEVTELPSDPPPANEEEKAVPKDPPADGIPPLSIGQVQKLNPAIFNSPLKQAAETYAAKYGFDPEKVKALWVELLGNTKPEDVVKDKDSLNRFLQFVAQVDFENCVDLGHYNCVKFNIADRNAKARSELLKLFQMPTISSADPQAYTHLLLMLVSLQGEVKATKEMNQLVLDTAEIFGVPIEKVDPNFHNDHSADGFINHVADSLDERFASVYHNDVLLISVELKNLLRAATFQIKGTTNKVTFLEFHYNAEDFPKGYDYFGGIIDGTVYHMAFGYYSFGQSEFLKMN